MKLENTFLVKLDSDGFHQLLAVDDSTQTYVAEIDKNEYFNLYIIVDFKKVSDSVSREIWLRSRIRHRLFQDFFVDTFDWLLVSETFSQRIWFDIPDPTVFSLESTVLNLYLLFLQQITIMLFFYFVFF